ncbi:MAG: hypothetical protein WC635_11455 [Bacteriovorax sp.]
MKTKNFIPFFCLFSLAANAIAAAPKPDNIQSSFKACQDKNILLTAKGNHLGLCAQGSSDSFSSLSNILNIATVMSFQKKIKDAVHTKIEFKIFETEMFEACANNDVGWFISKKMDWKSAKTVCDHQLGQIRNSIRTRFPEMRKQLALSSAPLRHSSLLNEQSGWFKTNIGHGMFSDFSKLKPLNSAENALVKKEFINDIASRALASYEKNKNGIRVSSLGTPITNIGDILTEGKKSSPNKSNHDILTEFMSNTKRSYSFSSMRWHQDDIQKSHKNEYFKIMNQMPLMGYIDDVDPSNADSPTDKQLAFALKKTKDKLKKYLGKLKANDKNGKDIKWAEYAQFTPDIEKILEGNPEFCGSAETLLKVKSKEERYELYEDLAIAGVAAVPCFFGGPITGTICIGAGLGVGAKGVASALVAKDKAESRNLTDFLGEDGMADFQAMNEKEREIVIQSVLLPMGAFGKTSIKGRMTTNAILKTYHAYDNVGAFLSKSEGLEMANQAMRKLVSAKNFEKLSAAEKAAAFDKILADQVLPKHLLSALENKAGGFKLIDTNYDFDSFPPDLLESLAAKLGSKEAALKFVKETYHRHVLDHHGSLGNVQNATQQVLSEFSKKADTIMLSTNPISRKIATETALRDMKKAYFRVSTDNLGDGQLATFLIKNHSKQMLTDPKFVKFMNRVANIEDFEAFGPGIYQKFGDYQAKVAKGIKLNADELLEFDAINVAMARQKAINDTLLKYGTDQSLGESRKALLFADRFNGLPPEIQKKMMAEVDELTKTILDNKNVRDAMARDYVSKANTLAGTLEKPGLIRRAEVMAQNSYANVDPKAVAQAKDEIFAFNATKLRTEYEKISGGKALGAFEVFQAPAVVLGGKKKVLVSITELGDKRSFVIAFGNGLRKNDDTLKSMAKEIHLVEKRTLEKLLKETADPEKVKVFQKELDAVKGALNGSDMEKFGGPASMMRSAADDANVKDLVFNFNGIRSSEADIMEAVVKGRASQAQIALAGQNKSIRQELFNKTK